MISLTWPSGRRRTVIIAGSGVVLLLVVGGYILWGNATWATYHTSCGDLKSKTKMDAQTALKLPTSSATQRTAKLKALALASKIILDGEKSSCKVSGLIGWQQSINTTYKKWQQECDATQKSIESLGDELHAASSYMKSEHELAIILSAALGVTKDKVTEGHLSTVLTKWKTAESAVKAMGVSEEFNPVKVTAQKVVGDVAAAWQSLVTAHVAKDETKYEKALKTVASAYSAIDDIEKESTQQVTRLSKTVQSRYEAVF